MVETRWLRDLRGDDTLMWVITIAVAIAFGFVLSSATVAFLLPALRRLKLQQHAYEDAPASHQGKTGTPTMGGIAFVVALFPFAVLALFFGTLRAPSLPYARWDFSVVALFVLVFVCAAIGFVDDYSAIRRGRNAGLRARTKYLLTAAAAACFLAYVNAHLPFGMHGVIFDAGTLVIRVPLVIWFALGILAVSGTIHAVNLTDGLDGLAAGTMFAPLVALAIVNLMILDHMIQTPILTRSGDTFVVQSYGASLASLSAVGAGACLGFLLFNRHPAKVFMGDTGSLALGALLSGIAILSGEMLLLILIGGVFVAEALSVIIQVTYFKRTGGKRIFKMSPLHHHFELSGWPETTVTKRFWLASAACSVAGVAVVALAGALNVR